MTPIAEGKVCSAPTSINKGIIYSLVLLFGGLAILAPLASAQNTGDCNPVEFRRDNVGGDTPDSNCRSTGPNECPPDGGALALVKEGSTICGKAPLATLGNSPGGDANIELAHPRVHPAKPPDFNRSIFYRNKLEFSQDIGWLPINIPFPFDFLLSDQYQLYPLKYTLVPTIGSLRWQLDSIKGPLILRGNWDLEFSEAVVAIPRGPETRYFAYMMGMRRNFVPRNWRATPYLDWRAGLGNINAKGPLGVPYAQGQNFTFTLNLGSGVRYNFSPRYAITAGLNWMHISNANLSEHKYNPADKYPWGFINYGINVYGPMVGVDIQLRKHPGRSEQ